MKCSEETLHVHEDKGLHKGLLEDTDLCVFACV